MNIDRDEIAHLTEEYGGQWGINHTRRLLHLISLIAEGRPYNADAIWLAAHLHDWGAYSPWAEAGVDHVQRSLQVAEAFLAERKCPPALMALVLECIEFHHKGDPSRSIEAILLSDADALDFLGAVGILRDFSRNPRELRKAYETTQRHRAILPGQLCLDRSKAMAAGRIQQMDDLFAAFEEQTFGYF